MLPAGSGLSRKFSGVMLSGVIGPAGPRNDRMSARVNVLVRMNRSNRTIRSVAPSPLSDRSSAALIPGARVTTYWPAG